MLRDLCELFVFVVGVLGLIPVWRDEKKRLLAVGLSCTLVAAVGYVWWEFHEQARADQEHRNEVASKGRQIVELLCSGPANYEEIYDKTSFAYSNEILDDAIEDLMRNRLIGVDIIHVPYAGPPQHELQVRMFRLKSQDACKNPSAALQ